MTWSDFKLRYKNSALDFFWSLLEPLLMLVVLYGVFSNLMHVQVEHYQFFLLLGIILWNFIDRGTSLEHVGIVGKPSLVQKVVITPKDAGPLSLEKSDVRIKLLTSISGVHVGMLHFAAF